MNLFKKISEETIKCYWRKKGIDYGDDGQKIIYR
jgi:hypothetical protein